MCHHHIGAEPLRERLAEDKKEDPEQADPEPIARPASD